MSRSALGIALLAALLAVVVLVALGVGSTAHGPWRALALLSGAGDGEEAAILFHIRLPRVLIGAGAGMALAIAGMLLQSATRNPLADSGVLGINAGAGLAVVLLVASYGARPAPVWMLPVAAAAGALATTGLLQVLAWRAGGVAPLRLLLIGIAVSATAAALMLVVALPLDGSLLRFVIAWQAGSPGGRDAVAAGVAVTAGAAGLLLGLLMGRRLDALGLGDEVAIGLGVAVERTRTQALVLAGGLAAAAVACAGNLGFIGIIAPALARALGGSRLRTGLPLAALAGAVVVVAADTVGRTIAAPLEIPTGILVALVGAPCLIVVLLRWSRP